MNFTEAWSYGMAVNSIFKIRADTSEKGRETKEKEENEKGKR